MPKIADPERLRLADHMSLSQMFRCIPMDSVKEALCATDSNDKRERDFPNREAVYFVIAMNLFSDKSIPEVYRCLSDTVKWQYGPESGCKTLAKSAFTQARQRLGPAALEHLFKAIVKPIAQPNKTRGAYFGDLALVAIDGVVLNVPDSEENDSAFGRPSTQSGPGPYPQIRCAGLVECGTHVMFDYEMDGYTTSEQALAERLLPRLRQGQLCIADRLYPTKARWDMATQTGAQLLWRIKSDFRLDVETELEDGSFLSTLHGAESRKRRQGTPVRVVPTTIQNSQGLIESCRLITTLSVEQASAEQLVRLYSERWEIETFLRELKTSLRATDVMRSKTPELVRQELAGAFLAHFSVRVLMHEAAISIGEDVDRLSFTHSLNAIRRNAPMIGAFSP